MSMSFCISVYNFFMFGSVIKELRAEMGITQAKLASILGCSQSMIARWEKGECEPTESVIVKAADTFNVSTDIILGRDYQREPILRASYCVNAKKRRASARANVHGLFPNTTLRPTISEKPSINCYRKAILFAAIPLIVLSFY